MAKRFLLICSLCLTNIFYAQTTFKDEQHRYIRVKQARQEKEENIIALFQTKHIAYPETKILIIAYKHEKLLQLWARPETTNTYLLIKEYDFTAFSGKLGPKRRRGDLQIPEGFYHINHFNPFSNFHLSLKINYPNRSDSILGKRENLGNEIRIHGNAVTIGCIPIGDEAIKELYVICVDARSRGQQKIPVYIFPGKMDDNTWNAIIHEAENDTSLIAFWKNLRQGYDIFKATARELRYSIDDQGCYNFENPIDQNFYDHPWLFKKDTSNMLYKRIPAPRGFERIHCATGSFADWLRHLPLKPNSSLVYLYNGREKPYQEGHYAVVDIDIGQQDLQQCADAVIRLYAEYLFSRKNFDNISFHLTNGDEVGFRTWLTGYRPTVSGNYVTWHKNAVADSSYSTLRAYLKFIFTYAGTYSLNQETQNIEDCGAMMIGDIFIQGGFPGHAVIVVDMAENSLTKEQVFLLAQSFMPAQDIHILKNPNDPEISPWYEMDFGDTLYTPEWIFLKHDLRTW